MVIILLSESLHDSLKQWLVELGKQIKDARGNPRYEAYSGDSQPVDIRYGKKHVEYNPDVVWRHRGRLYIIELAFSENWRSIVGEIALASMIKDCRLFLITQGFPTEFMGNLVPLFGKKLGVNWMYYNYEEESDLESMKKDFRRWLKDSHWI
jgi:hypothetical protein